MKLHIPEPIKPTIDASDSQPEQFKQWLADLPQTNMGELTRHIFNTLCEHNKYAIPDADRFANLEMLRESLREIFNNLNKRLNNRTLPLTEKNQKIVNLYQSLLREVALGYRILINNIANGADDDAGLVSTAICRAIRYQSESLLCASEVYAQSPAGTWLDLHTIFAYASSIGVTKKTINDFESTTGTATIEDYYKQVLLFALARPSSLRQLDTEHLYRELSAWAKLTEISDTPDKSQIERIFCVRVEEDRPPTYLKAEDCENKYPVKTLSTTALSDTIQNNLIEPNNTSGTFKSRLSIEALQTIATSWGIFAERRFTRSARIGHVTTAISVSSAANAIKNEETIRKSSDPLYEEHIEEFRVQLNASLAPLNINKQNKKSDNPTKDSADNQRAITYSDNLQIGHEDLDSNWEVVNASAGGYCLRWNSDDTSKAQIGELIALRERETNGSYQWLVGAIRWMQYTREHGLEIGVELLSPGAISATIKRKNSSELLSENCIILLEANTSLLPTTILLPTDAFNVDEFLELNTLDQVMEIKLISVREKTGLFTRFVFTRTEAPIKLYNKARNNSHENADDFADIWSFL